MAQVQNSAASGTTMPEAQDHGAWEKPCRRMKLISQAEADLAG
jgi:hypothetical protein